RVRAAVAAARLPRGPDRPGRDAAERLTAARGTPRAVRGRERAVSRDAHTTRPAIHFHVMSDDFKYAATNSRPSMKSGAAGAASAAGMRSNAYSSVTVS